VLRGLAIFGTLGTNIWLFAEVGSAESSLFSGGTAWWASLDSFLASLTLFLTNGKFLGLLTILFGVGLEVQYRSAKRRGLRWPVRYLWRSTLLFFEGLLHYVLVFEFDILMGYAVAAAIVAFLVGRGERMIRRAMWISGGIHVAFFGAISALAVAASLLPDANASFTVFADRAAQAYASGSWWDEVLFRLDNFWFYRTEPIAILPMNVFLFLLGVRLMRSGAFAPGEGGQRIRRKMLHWGLLPGVPLNLLYFVPDGLFELPVRYLFAPILSLGYAGLVALAMERGILSPLTDRLGEVGRMALSCYVTQNILSSAIFYGWGFGLTGRIGAAGTLAVATGICAILMFLANLWLRRFPSGPLEMLWRWLSALPFRKAGG
jgi:uncharacterized protein